MANLRFITALCISILAGSEMDIFIPSFSVISQQFFLSPAMVELALTVNFISFGLFALLSGHLSDRYSHRYIIIPSLIVFIFGCFICLTASSFSSLLIGRFLQGAGIAGPSVLEYLIIQDHYPREKRAVVFGFLNGACTLAMAIAPVLGSYITAYAGWKLNFVFLILLGTCSLILSAITLPKQEKNDIVDNRFKGYQFIPHSKKLWIFIISLCFLTVPYWVFIGIAPLLYIDNLGVSTEYFGYYQGMVALSFVGASFFSSKLIQSYGEALCFKISLLLCVLSALYMAYVCILGFNIPIVLTLGMSILAGGIAFPLNVLYVECLGISSNFNSRVTALIRCMRLTLTAVFIEFVSLFYDGSVSFFTLTLFILIVISLLLVYYIYIKNWISYLNIKQYKLESDL